MVSGWPCTDADCHEAADCADALGGRCGWYGGEPERDVPADMADDADAYLADEVPLPEEPDVEEPWDPQPIRVEEIPDGLAAAVPDEYRAVPLSAEEQAARRAHVAAARRVHVVPRSGPYARLGAEFDPRGRHVGCDGEVGPAGGMVGGCGANPGEACRPPASTAGRRRFVAGFVHPSRIAAERAMFGIEEPVPEPA